MKRALLRTSLVVGLALAAYCGVHVVERSRTRVREKQRKAEIAGVLWQLKIGGWGTSTRFPAAVNYDTEGFACTSWRFTIVASEIGGDAWAARSVPWTAPESEAFRGMSPSMFCAERSNDTTLLAVVGDGTVFDRRTVDGPHPDGWPSTLLLIESPDSGVHWMSPVDIDIRRLRVDGQTLAELDEWDGISSVLLGFQDQKVWRVSTEVPTEALADVAMVGDESPDREALIGQYRVRP